MYEFEGREVVDMGERGCVYLDNQQSVSRAFLPDTYTRVKEEIETGKKKKNTALHIACELGNIDMVKILLTHPNIKTDIKNYENKSPRDCIAEYVKEVIEPEFIKIEKRNQILEPATQKSNCAYTLLLTEALAVGLCFVVDNPVPLAAAALLFFIIGGSYLYRANTVLNDVNFSQVDFERTC